MLNEGGRGLTRSLAQVPPPARRDRAAPRHRGRGPSLGRLCRKNDRAKTRTTTNPAKRDRPRLSRPRPARLCTAKRTRRSISQLYLLALCPSRHPLVHARLPLRGPSTSHRRPRLLRLCAAPPPPRLRRLGARAAAHASPAATQSYRGREHTCCAVACRCRRLGRDGESGARQLACRARVGGGNTRLGAVRSGGGVRALSRGGSRRRGKEQGGLGASALAALVLACRLHRRCRFRSAAPQQLLQHLVFSIILLAIPTLFSAELSDIRRSRHHAFFLEPGFWAQETAMALLSLVGLGSFWHLVSVRSRSWTQLSSRALTLPRHPGRPAPRSPSSASSRPRTLSSSPACTPRCSATRSTRSRRERRSSARGSRPSCWCCLRGGCSCERHGRRGKSWTGVGRGGRRVRVEWKPRGVRVRCESGDRRPPEREIRRRRPDTLSTLDSLPSPPTGRSAVPRASADRRNPVQASLQRPSPLVVAPRLYLPPRRAS